ncbi:MAG: UvrB/UvrC motif-containing protein [Planctomycetota bacterium]|nr:UvrB/UvrC motif-containing protein [Planctomycetota bacterium]
MLICQICKKKQATIHLTDIHNNVKKEVHMCEGCASEKGFSLQSAADIPQLLGLASKKKVASPQAVEEDIVCPVCGQRWSDFNSRGRLGCPNDYQAFEPRLRKLVESQLSSWHPGEVSLHSGKVPPGAPPDLSRQLTRIHNLERELRQAVEMEHFEEAARLKSEISRLKVV